MAEPPDDAPQPELLADAFQVYEVRRNGENVVYFGDPVVPQDEVLGTVWERFRDRGYDVEFGWRSGEFVLVAAPQSTDTGDDGFPWTNLVLFLLTAATTLYAGAGWFHVRDVLSLAVLEAAPFAAAVLFVLGTHELGHYAMSRYHGVDATLPYFIPMLPPFGTMGAVIRMRGRIPDREALFDIGVAGPIAGLVATVVVTVVGLTLPPVHVPAWVFDGPTLEVEFGYPLLLQGLAALLGEPLSYADRTKAVNPVVLGGWIGMFVTFLNLIPVGQLDGGHVTRALLGPEQRRFARLVPGVLFGLAAYLYFVADVVSGVGIWVFWGVIAFVLASVGPADPIHDEPLDRRRQAVGVLTLLAGLLCFHPIPIQIVS